MVTVSDTVPPGLTERNVHYNRYMNVAYRNRLMYVRSTESTEVPKAGRPRSEKTRVAILEAAADLLEEGGFSATNDRVDRGSREGEQGHYLQVVAEPWRRRHRRVSASTPPNAHVSRYRATCAEDLTAQVLVTAGHFEVRAGEIMADLIGQAQCDPALGETFRSGWLQPRREATTAVIQRGVDRGELRSDMSIPVMMDQILRPVVLSARYSDRDH